ncbi:acetamidase/formamidase family protein [Actinomadura madurae]|uniref:acetamidase/formamidase family protein n=1 Tax=Actinomadura madurae TaxID=1993 RepID=UPI0020D2245F|nr:acetamidase/formamidase family protein [Actinomadura madurae]MCQ0019823.1 acetamidase/formamidase family protein [Actinomadura madurae]
MRVRGAKLSAGDLHFPARGGDGCDGAAAPGWIDLRVNLTRRGVERFRVTGPMLMPDPSPRVA